MRVAHVITGLGVGGAETMLFRLLSMLPRGDFDPMVLSLSPPGPMGERIAGLDVPVLSLGMSNRLPQPRALARLARELRRFRPDVVQTWMYHADLLGGVAARLTTSATVVWGLHNSTLDPVRTPWSTRAVVAACARLSRRLPHCILSCSEVARGVHTALGYDAERVIVIPNGFDLGAFRPSAADHAAVRAELGLAAATVLVGLVARWDPQKDHASFIGAAAHVARQHPAIHFLLVGTAVDEANAALSDLVAGTGFAERFHLLGERADVPRLMAALDVAVSAAAYGEAFPLVIGEAMASGVPCVVTDVGDSAVMVGATGRVVPPREPVALAAALRDLLALTPEQRRELGASARARVGAEYDLTAVAGRYADLYRSLVACDHC
ncbi:glycosyltransferase [uncultured Thiohalocapsa sp.]|uniref:glycosyltransferase n=1 Tax=uncultured Thiohalocapsa sp. TaxID=768990 RepID=UPI0025EBEC76|nr:glycosyltransferase [uncultured Thiohalocapsa sp.]